ncbi:cupin domain-containing protein [Sphingomonas sp. CL5.1]|uniref:cupin domain-containing protein n=1 Tax=Sphingomonas sp. CL5.1 TaxID=2653203 RepID=UPI001583A1A0|nr:cupin domain-containing protein [Sphingomonas sp. CL5.1]QKS01095.1 cupin domain-containing protein [Sphingomonas sp. CL5.1]
MTFTNRRIVTGLNENGKSCVISDTSLGDIPGCQSSPAIIWQTGDFPVDNRGREEAAGPFGVSTFGKSSFAVMFRVEPDTAAAWHATDTIDYLIILSGRIELSLEAGTVELGTGDILVDRGVPHSWRALDGKPATMFAALVRAAPLGTGSYFDESFTQFTQD